MFWILTPDPARGYGVTYTTTRDEGVLAEVTRASRMFASLESAEPPERLTEDTHHLVPRQFAWTRSAGDPATIPQKLLRDDRSILYRFKPRMAAGARFEKLGSGSGYIWGFGVGNLDYIVPAREDRRRVSEIIVRAHIQPVPPIDARPQDIKTRVTLFINGTDCGSRLVSAEATGQTLVQEWKVDSFWVRLRAMRGLPLTIRFAVTPEADWPYGLNISNWPAGYEAHDAKPVEKKKKREEKKIGGPHPKKTGGSKMGVGTIKVKTPPWPTEAGRRPHPPPPPSPPSQTKDETTDTTKKTALYPSPTPTKKKKNQNARRKKHTPLKQTRSGRFARCA